MNMFADVLRGIDCRLDLPQPHKSRIMLEIASDMEYAFEEYLESGMDIEEARARAIERFDISGEALVELVDLHESGFRRLLGTLSMQARSWWERSLLVVIILFVAMFSGRQVFTSGLLRDAGAFIWGVASFSSAAVVMAAWHAYRLYLKKEHDRRRLRKGLPFLLLSGCGCILTGLLGSSVGIYYAITHSAAGSGELARNMLDGAISGSALNMVCLVAAIGIFLLWFILMNKAWEIESAELEWLMSAG